MEGLRSVPNANSPLGVWVSPKQPGSTLWVRERNKGVRERNKGVRESHGGYVGVVVLVVAKFAEFVKLFLGY
jgi:hypothetical protein